MSSRIAIGVGCRSGCPAEVIEALVRQALDLAPVATQSGGLYQSCVDQCELLIQHTKSLPSAAGTPAEPAAERDELMRRHTKLFTIEDKIGEVGLAQAAGRLEMELVFLTRDALREQAANVHTRSWRSEQLFGVPGVAEAAALAGAGPGAILIVPRIAGSKATCAIAGAAS